MKQPNILLIVCDQFRYDCMSYQNHPNVKTPNLDTLAAEGCSFDHAYSAVPSCIPARAALLTGQSQLRHGRVGYEDGIDWTYPHYLAEEFTKAHYQTQCIGKMHVHPPRLACGFEGLKLHDGYLDHYRQANIPHWMHQEVCDDYLFDLRNKLDNYADFNASGPGCNSWITHPWIYDEALHPTNWVVDQCIRFLKTRDRTRPFFLNASFVRPHQPLDPPKSYLDMYLNQPLRKPAQGDWVDPSLTDRYGRIADSIYGCIDERMKHEAMAGYYASITHVDHQIGRLLSAIREDGEFEDTIIVFLSDHGELLFDNNYWRKALPYEGSVHIPMIFRIGKKIADTTPWRSCSITELRDVMPTLLDLANIKIPDTVDGLSLKNEILNHESIDRPYLHGEHSFHSQLSNHYIVTQHDKYIWFSEKDEEQYFDLTSDPLEEHNLIHDPACQKRIQELRQYLIHELKMREEGYSDGEKLLNTGHPVNTLKHLIK